MTKQELRDLALASGFRLSERPDCSIDMNPCVYNFAEALLSRVESNFIAEVEILRQALDDVYAEAQNHAGEYAAFNAKVANQALLKTSSHCLKRIQSDGFFDYLKKLPDSNRMVPINHIKDYIAQHARNLRYESSRFSDEGI